MIPFLLKHLFLNTHLISAWTQDTHRGWGDRQIYTLENPRFDINGQWASWYGDLHHSHAIDGIYDETGKTATAFDLQAQFLVDINEAITNNQNVYPKEIRIFINAPWSGRSDMPQ